MSVSIEETDGVFQRRRAQVRVHLGRRQSWGSSTPRGQDIPRDDGKALHLFRQAADQGSNEASAALGFMCIDGRGVQQSSTEAVKWFRTAADRGLSVAQAARGFMYSGGRGVSQDYVQAYMWLSVSEIEGHGEVRRQLETFAAKMSPQQMARAKQLARDWKPRQ